VAGCILWISLGAFQDAKALEQMLSLIERACDLDPEARAGAFEEGPGYYRKNEGRVLRFSDSSKAERRIAAKIIRAMAGQGNPEELLGLNDRRAWCVACELLKGRNERIPDFLKFIREPDLGLRLAAARALGALTEKAAQTQVQQDLSRDKQAQATPLDVAAHYVLCCWGASDVRMIQGNMASADPQVAETAVAALSNLSPFQFASGFASRAGSVLGDPRIPVKLREILVRVIARHAFSQLIPLLAVQDPSIRAHVVELLDRGLSDPVLAAPLVELSKHATVQKLDDGKSPPVPLLVWIGRWLKRLTGRDGDLGALESWVKSNQKTVIDKQTDGAIKMGIEALRSFSTNGQWTFFGKYPVGSTALVVYTMLKCDVSVDDPDVVKGLELMLNQAPEGTYSASLVAMALATAIEKVKARPRPALPRWRARLQEVADYLVSSQKPCGGWHYPIVRESGTGVRNPAPLTDSYDLSNTQFAVLGLRAAENAGARVPRTTWERALALYEKHQSPTDKGWPYVGTDPERKTVASSSHAMTAAGAYSYMICKGSLDGRLSPEELGKLAPVQGALDYLDRKWKVDATGIGDAYYWLYSLERMCMAGSLGQVGTHDWYYEGAGWILAQQEPKGGWSANHGTMADTCFALLFLRRAYVAPPFIETRDPVKDRSK
jgi:hypothetical protein